MASGDKKKMQDASSALDDGPLNYAYLLIRKTNRQEAKKGRNHPRTH
jgi:hypothetical protein